MGIFTDKKPYTAISSNTEALIAGGSDPDPSKLLNLVELINESVPTGSGGRESGRIIRKKIKYGTSSEQIRAVSLTETLVDNGVPTLPFVIDSGLSDQLVQLAASHPSRADLTKEAKAARLARSLLHSWHSRGERHTAQLYKNAGLVDKHERSHNRRSAHVDDDLDEDFAGQLRSPGHSRSHSRSVSGSYPRSHSRQPSGVADSPDRRSRSMSRSSPRVASRSPSPVINIRGASIETIIATAHNTATKLTTALIENPRGGAEAESYYRQAKQLRKRVIQLIHDSSSEVQAFIGQLLSANEELIASLQAHDAVIQSGDALDEQDDHEQLDSRTISQLRKPQDAPQRRAPSPTFTSDQEESEASDFEDRESARSGANPPVEDPFDPFGDSNEQQERPKHTPLW